LISEERLKNHRLLADDLERILLNGAHDTSTRRNANAPLDLPKDRERGFPLVDVAEPDYGWERLVALPKTLLTLRALAEEHHRRDVLASGGLRPRRKALFFGPPGCGKTLAAQVLAGVLARPLVTVRFDAVVSSYLGETAANLHRVFDFIERGEWIVLFDEFDAIGKDRDNPFEHGELKRVVNTLLQLMDAYRGNSLLIAATNHEGLLDEAIWRRFEAVVHFGAPSEQDRVLLLRLFLRGFDTSNVNFRSVAHRTPGATGSDIELITVEAARAAVLAGRTHLHMADMDASIAAFHDRRAAAKGAARIAPRPPAPKRQKRPGA
jgi:SpoVK/Ycf46/Vps4 family AAA+-type ATPase